MGSKTKIGMAGEEAVGRYLVQKGFRILARNYRTDHGEIDVIAANDRYLVFCEVKTRKEGSDFARYGRPSHAVNQQKRQHLLYSAKVYMKQTYGTDAPEGLYPRMDVAEVLYREENGQMKFRVHYIERAFGAGDCRRPSGYDSHGGYDT